MKAAEGWSVSSGPRNPILRPEGQREDAVPRVKGHPIAALPALLPDPGVYLCACQKVQASDRLLLQPSESSTSASHQPNATGSFRGHRTGGEGEGRSPDGEYLICLS